MKKCSLLLAAVACFAFTGCVRTITKPVNAECRPPVTGLKNPGVFPGQTMNTDGSWRSTRNTVDSDGILWCPAPLDGDENDPRNEAQALAYVQQPVAYAVVPPRQTAVVQTTTVEEPVVGLGFNAEVNIPSNLTPVYNPPPQRSY